MGAVDGAAARRRFACASLPALRHRRLRRRQSLRVPDDARASTTSTRSSSRCSPKPSAAARGPCRLMRLAVIRQRYTPFGGAERFLESALQALLERGVASRCTRANGPRARMYRAAHRRSVSRWPLVARLGLRARRLRCTRARRAALVQSHERLACCDIFRAGDGVHAVWLDERLRHLTPLRALRHPDQPVSSLRAGDGAAAVRERAAARGHLQFADGARRHPHAFRLPDERLPSSTTRSTRTRSRPTFARTARGSARNTGSRAGAWCSCSSAPASSAKASPRDRRARAVARPGASHRRRQRQARRAICGSRAPARAVRPRHARRPANRSAAVLRRGRRVRAADALRPVVPTPRSRRWRAGCRSSPARAPARPSWRSRTMQASSASRAMPISSRRTCTRCRTAPSAREWAPTAARRAAADIGRDDVTARRALFGADGGAAR